MIRRKLSAFTLIEMLITLTIFSVISVSLYSTFSSGISAWKRSKDANLLCHEARFALNRMATELHNAIIYDFGQQYTNVSAFQGKSDSITFFIETGSGIKKISYFLETPEYEEIHRTVVNYHGSMPSEVIVKYQESQASLVSLVRKEEPFLDSVQAKANEQIRPKTVSAMVKEGGLSFEYAYAKASTVQQGQGSQAQAPEINWQDSWDDNTKLPRGIKIILTLENPTKTYVEEQAFVKTVFIPTGEMGGSAQ